MSKNTKNTTLPTGKQLTDHKKSSEEIQLEFNELDGADLLIPFNKVKGSNQARLLARVQALGIDDTEEDTGLDLDVVADFIDYVTDTFAVDKEKFEDFTAGRGGFERALNLTVAYAAELGKDES